MHIKIILAVSGILLLGGFIIYAKRNWLTAHEPDIIIYIGPDFTIEDE
jgi:hypothetical protein